MALLPTNYVKFIRGTTAAYNKLESKDKDTLYFISDNNTSGQLYLGSKLISGGSGGGVSEELKITLSELQDILFGDNLDTNHVLMYDAELGKWINAPITDALGDIVSNTKIYETILEEGETHDTALLRVVGEAPLNNGDIAVIKELIASEKYQYTTYVYDKTNARWVATDGNYKAENVYFQEDLMTTTQVGVIKLTNGQATIPASGKNLKEVFNTIFVKEENPRTTQPSVTVTLAKAGNYEVGTTVKDITWTAKLNAGSYSYGPATGITPVTWSGEDSAGKKFSAASGTSANWLVEDNKPFSVSATATYEKGAVPVTNTGNPYPAGQITNGSKTGTSSPIVGYRSYFYGPDASGAEINSDFIRTNLTNSNEALTSKTIDWKAADTEGIKRYIVAIPESANKSVTSAIITSSMNANALDDYKLQTATVDVEGADDYTAVPYKVWIYAPASIANVEEHTITLG